MKIIFAGTPEFSVPALQMLLGSQHEVVAVYTQPDRPAGRGRKLQASPIKALAVEANIPVYQPLNFKHELDIKQLKALNADVMIVVAYGLILSQEVLDIPKLGCLNIHGSLLPRWRGAAPINRAIMAGDKETGITIMRVVKKLDAGDMLYKITCDINEHETATDLHNRMMLMGAEGLDKTLELLAANDLMAEPQDESLVTYAHKLTKQEAILDWQQSAVLLARQIRGLNAWPVAQTALEGKIMRVWKAEALNIKADVDAGTILENSEYIDVATGDGVLRLLEIQMPGKKRVAVSDFLNANTVAGLKLGILN